jgi:hypothetical protein
MAADDYAPIINAIHMEADSGNLFAAASDRYTLAVARIGGIPADENWRAMIPAADLSVVLHWLKAADDGSDVEVTVTETAPIAELTLATKGATLTISAEVGGGFPFWRTLIRAQLTGEQQPVDGSAWNSRFLARWKAGSDVLHATQAGPGKPLLFSDRGGDFIGMQMPVKEPDPVTVESIAARWLHVITPIAYVDHQAYRLDRQWADKDGDVWEHTDRQRYGEPLMRLVGIEDDDHTLRQLVKDYGPITPVLAESEPAGA